MDEPRVYRAPMRSRDDEVPHDASIARALQLNVVGMGERLHSDEESRAARERLARRIERFAEAPHGSFVWTRDLDGFFWLGRLTGSLRRDDSTEAAQVDLVQIRPCHWREAPVDRAVAPIAVHATFARGGRNWQEIHGEGLLEATARLWTDPHPKT